jgi:glycine/D-amino acid oxidase-like deaminating enzyme/nitrite reductase/ring-hydroxylating ferredoxin subunit
MSNVEQEQSHSLWMEVPGPRFTPLNESLTADVVVVGGGMAGLSIAYELSQLNRDVVVLDRGRIGRGMTARTTAHLAFEIDDYFHELIKVHGKDHARQWYESQSAAVDRIELICRENAIDCDFARVDGLFVPAEERDVDYLKKELESAREAGFHDARWMSSSESELGLEGVRFPRQGRFHPVRYLNGLVELMKARGVRFFEDTDVVSIKEDGGRLTVETGGGVTVTCTQAVDATNAATIAPLPQHTRQAPYRTYAIALPVPKGSAPDVLLWDTVEPGYHYVRIQPGETGDMLIVGGEDHKSGTRDDGEERIRALEAWTRQRYPQAGAIAYAWSGQVYEPQDYVGFIGKMPGYDEVYLVTGDSGQGITTSVAASLILRDLMNGRENPWAEVYKPGRSPHRGIGEFIKENVEATKHWAEILGPGEVNSLNEIAAGEGALIKVNGKPVAAYRGENGEVQAVSAICTHAGCVVHWNGFEGCWDCPCHGSQFDVSGAVLNGPAVKPLAAAELDEQHEKRPAEDDRPQIGMP